jgi:hypothetical protein
MKIRPVMKAHYVGLQAHVQICFLQILNRSDVLCAHDLLLHVHVQL